MSTLLFSRKSTRPWRYCSAASYGVLDGRGQEVLRGKTALRRAGVASIGGPLFELKTFRLAMVPCRLTRSFFSMWWPAGPSPPFRISMRSTMESSRSSWASSQLRSLSQRSFRNSSRCCSDFTAATWRVARCYGDWLCIHVSFGRRNRSGAVHGRLRESSGRDNSKRGSATCGAERSDRDCSYRQAYLHRRRCPIPHRGHRRGNPRARSRGSPGVDAARQMLIG